MLKCRKNHCPSPHSRRKHNTRKVRWLRINKDPREEEQKKNAAKPVATRDLPVFDVGAFRGCDLVKWSLARD